jgi:hypothetical protein
MAMTTKTENPKKAENRQSSLKRRIRQFYDLLNQRDFGRCYQMIDPRVRNKASSVTMLQYENSVGRFLDTFGSVKNLEISINLHLDEPSKLYEGRDFAVGNTAWMDEGGEQHLFSERWVCEGRVWYTRSTGFIVSESAMLLDAATGESSSIERQRRQTRKVKVGKE